MARLCKSIGLTDTLNTNSTFKYCKYRRSSIRVCKPLAALVYCRVHPPALNTLLWVGRVCITGYVMSYKSQVEWRLLYVRTPQPTHSPKPSSPHHALLSPNPLPQPRPLRRAALPDRSKAPTYGPSPQLHVDPPGQTPPKFFSMAF